MSTPAQDGSFGWPWLALAAAVAAHVTDEALTGFLDVYNPTVLEARQRLGWFPMPVFTFETWLSGLVAGTILLFSLTPLAFRGARWLRPFAYFVAVLMILNALGHTLGTIFGRSFPDVTFQRPMPGFYSSPLLFVSAVWMLVTLQRGRRMARSAAASGS